MYCLSFRVYRIAAAAATATGQNINRHKGTIGNHLLMSPWLRFDGGELDGWG